MICLISRLGRQSFRIARPAMCLILGLTTASCTTLNPARLLVGGSNEIEIVSLTQHPVQLTTSFDHACYYQDSTGSASILLTDTPLEHWRSGQISHGQALHIDLMWIPKPGKTPLDPSATNITVRHVIISNGAIGIYAGGGFALPSGRPGDDSLGLSIRDASLQLSGSTSGFRDLLSPATLTGQIDAKLDDRAARQLRLAISQVVTDALGHSRLVSAR